MKTASMVKVRRRVRSKSPIASLSGYSPRSHKTDNSTSCSDNSIHTSPSSRTTWPDVGSESTGSSDTSPPMQPRPQTAAVSVQVDLVAVPPQETAVPTPRFATATTPRQTTSPTKSCSKNSSHGKWSQRYSDSEDAILNPPDDQAEVSWVEPRATTPVRSRSKSPGPDARQVQAALQDAEIARARALRAIGYRKEGENIRGSGPMPLSPRAMPRMEPSSWLPESALSPRFAAQEAVDVVHPPRQTFEAPRQTFEAMHQTMPCMTMAQKVIELTPTVPSKQRSSSFSPEPRELTMPSKQQTTPHNQISTPPRSPRYHAAMSRIDAVKALYEDRPPREALRNLKNKPNAYDSFEVWRAQLRIAAGIGVPVEESAPLDPSPSQGDNYERWRERLGTGKGSR